MSNQYLTTFYVGITSDLKRRIYEHKNKIIKGFTEKYNLVKFLYFEKYNSIIDAIEREKQIKNFKREWKLDLIKNSNPLMCDLYDWLINNDDRLNVENRIIKENNKIYEVPIVRYTNAIAGQARNDGGVDKENLEIYQSCTRIQCPAKVNLSLKVVEKRPDGFHNIESIMQTISLYDFLNINIEPSERMSTELSGNSNEIPYDEKNLVYKAVQMFLDYAKPSPHKISIYIEKNIPVAAGLAGGSTDAAGTLFGLNEIFSNPLSKEELHKLCSKLGSDLNVCLEGGRLMTRGRGEIVEPMNFEEFKISLIKPVNLGISAKEAYTKFSKKKESGFVSQYGINKDFKNDLEWAVIDDYKELQKIKTLYPDSMMSGSGSTYFIIDKEFDEINDYQIFNNLKSINNGVCVVKK